MWTGKSWCCTQSRIHFGPAFLALDRIPGQSATTNTRSDQTYNNSCVCEMRTDTDALTLIHTDKYPILSINVKHFCQECFLPFAMETGWRGGCWLGNLWGKQKHCVTKFRADIDGFELPSSKKQQHLQLIKYISTELPLCVRIFPLASYRTSLNGAPSRSLLRLI